MRNDIDVLTKKIQATMKASKSHLKNAVPVKVAAMRNNMNLTQTEISNIIGVYKQNWYKVEKGINILTLEQAIALSALFGCTVDYLVKDDKSQGLSRVEELLQEQLKTERELNKMLQDRVEELKREVKKWVEK